MVKPGDLERVIQFRERLVAYMNQVLTGGLRYEGGLSAQNRATLTSERTWLAQEYGRLYRIINQYGGMAMRSPALGITSHDVIQDAIHDIDDMSYNDLARLSEHYLDTVIGRLQSEGPEVPVSETIYRLTSPVFWLTALGRVLARLWGSTRGRIAAFLGAVLVATIAAILSGFAQAFAQSWLRRP